MEKLKNVLLVLVGMGFMIPVVGGLCYAQPKIDIGKMPSDTPSDVKVQIERIYSKDPIERAKGAFNLGKMGKSAAPAIPFLIGILGDKVGLADAAFGGITSPGMEASWALVKMGELAVDPLIAALKDKQTGVQREVATTLGKIKDPRAVGPLIVSLKDEDLYVKNAAARALVEIGKPAVEPLIATIKNKDEKPYIRKEAVEALEEITGQDFGEDPAKWQEWWEENK